MRRYVLSIEIATDSAQKKKPLQYKEILQRLLERELFISNKSQ